MTLRMYVVTLHSHVNYVVGRNTKIGRRRKKKTRKMRNILHAVLPDQTPVQFSVKFAKNNFKNMTPLRCVNFSTIIKQMCAKINTMQGCTVALLKYTDLIL
jgi:hypothetical protein